MMGVERCIDVIAKARVKTLWMCGFSISMVFLVERLPTVCRSRKMSCPS